MVRETRCSWDLDLLTVIDLPIFGTGLFLNNKIIRSQKFLFIDYYCWSLLNGNNGKLSY